MIVQSQPIPINQRRESGFYRRSNRFSAQRNQSLNYPKYASPPQGSSPQIPELPRGDFQEWPICPPTQLPTVGFFPGPAFPADPRAVENVNVFGQQDGNVDLRDETPSPPVGFSATSMRGFAGSPPYPMPLRNEFSPPSNAQSSDAIYSSAPSQYEDAVASDGIYSSTPSQYEDAVEQQEVTYQQQMYTTRFQVCWPQNQLSPPYPFNFFPSPPAPSIVPCGVYGFRCPLPLPQREESVPNNLPLLRPMPFPLPIPMPYLGMRPEVVEPPPMPVIEDNGNANGSRRILKRRTQRKRTNVGSENQIMKVSEDENWRLGNRQRSFSTPAISSPHCSFCKSNRETRQFYLSHVLKNDDGVTTCPILRKYTCPICKAVGDSAHTLKYCPENQDGALSSRERSLSLSSQKSALKKKRNSRGIIGAYRYG